MPTKSDARSITAAVPSTSSRPQAFDNAWHLIANRVETNFDDGELGLFDQLCCQFAPFLVLPVSSRLVRTAVNDNESIGQFQRVGRIHSRLRKRKLRREIDVPRVRRWQSTRGGERGEQRGIVVVVRTRYRAVPSAKAMQVSVAPTAVDVQIDHASACGAGEAGPLGERIHRHNTAEQWETLHDGCKVASDRPRDARSVALLQEPRNRLGGDEIADVLGEPDERSPTQSPDCTAQGSTRQHGGSTAQ